MERKPEGMIMGRHGWVLLAALALPGAIVATPMAATQAAAADAAAQAGPAPARAANAQAVSPRSYDGSYQGRARLVHGSAAACPASRYGVVDIGDAALVFPYQPTLVLAAPVQPDGTLHAADGKAVLDGKVVRGRLAFTVRTPDCETEFHGHVVWNHP